MPLFSLPGYREQKAYLQDMLSSTSGFDAAFGAGRGVKRRHSLTEMLWLTEDEILSGENAGEVDSLIEDCLDGNYEQTFQAIHESALMHWQSSFTDSGSYFYRYPVMMTVMKAVFEEDRVQSHIEKALDLAWLWLLPEDASIFPRKKFARRANKVVLARLSHLLLLLSKQKVFDNFDKQILFVENMHIIVEEVGDILGRHLHANRHLLTDKLGIITGKPMNTEQCQDFARLFVEWAVSPGSDGGLLEDSDVLKEYIRFAALSEEKQALTIKALKDDIAGTKLQAKILLQAKLTASAHKERLLNDAAAKAVANPTQAVVHAAIEDVKEDLIKATQILELATIEDEQHQRNIKIMNIQLHWLSEEDRNIKPMNNLTSQMTA